MAVGTEVSPKFKGGCCEAKVKRIFKNIKFRAKWGLGWAKNGKKNCPSKTSRRSGCCSRAGRSKNQGDSSLLESLAPHPTGSSENTKRLTKRFTDDRLVAIVQYPFVGYFLSNVALQLNSKVSTWIYTFGLS
ncbi:unnamed protein product, partial [Mesorhabditis belari]|uniref:Uncharacterized protein n=1 Tax=Mesorhabditis belari TaxID=2138241 RepID=A0AAF3J4B6_9BILA